MSARGKRLCWPTVGLSKRQACISTSTSGAEMVATDHALRTVGMPGLDLWRRLLPDGPKMKVLGDNMAMLQCIRSGRNPTMRHLSRTRQVPIGWIHERCLNNDFEFVREAGTKMPPDIFTKMFSDKAKWTAARHLINVAFPE